MKSSVFHAVISEVGHLGVMYNHSEALTMVGYRSKFASRKANEWLERRLVKLYTRYYYRVLIETRGRFWSGVDAEALRDTKGGK